MTLLALSPAQLGGVFLMCLVVAALAMIAVFREIW